MIILLGLNITNDILSLAAPLLNSFPKDPNSLLVSIMLLYQGIKCFLFYGTFTGNVEYNTHRHLSISNRL
jgi:hypothetical protein